MSERKFSLDDKYLKTEGQIALTGVQALVRLTLDQHRRDRAAGIRTGTFVSGYQGSPLGELDKQFRLAGALLPQHHVVFQPGINEDVAATAIYGTQMLEKFSHANYDGVVGMWYGKGPGVDRSGDAFRHGNYIGTGKYGAALALGGDDPACKSSTIPTDTTVAFYDVHFPTLYPGNPGEVLELGLHAFALSRYAGLWAALKIVTNVADGGAIIEVHPDLALPVIPELEIGGKPFVKQQGLTLLPPFSLEYERQIIYERMAAAKAYVRANRLDRMVVSGPADRVGLLAAGKTYVDLMQALELLGLGPEQLTQAGIRVYKLAMISPVEPEGLGEFARGLEEIVVVEEKRGFTEVLIRDALYNHPSRPAVYGKLDRRGQPLFPAQSEMHVEQIARILADYLAEKLGRQELRERVNWLVEIEQRPLEPVMPRTPYFCSGCPHNTSTKVLEDDQVGGGIGCHAMAAYMNRGVTWLTHMGGEGGPWLGLAPFVDKDHIFQNVGDGTYYHSASKALEACISAGTNITFRLLYNAAVAMTGGQDVVGVRPPIELARQLEAQGVREIVIVPEKQEQYPKKRISPAIRVASKEDYNAVMLELKKVRGVTVILFDQQCAAEKRRERKRGIQEMPSQRVFINPAVCEGCGDCGVKSNCLSVVPVETPYGRKTQIHQSSCNMDYSCLKGDCPAFMTVELGPLTKPVQRQGAAGAEMAALPEPPEKVDCSRPYKMLMVGIGGTGVVTTDALLVTAALLEGKYAVHLDQTGLAQKGGAVVSNLTLSIAAGTHANKISAGEADLVLAFDILATMARENLNRCHPERTTVVANTARISTAQEVTDIRAAAPAREALVNQLEKLTRKGRNRFFDAEQITAALFGDHLSNNVFMLGVAYQAGLLPLGAASIEGAIRANGVAVEQNLKAFGWGRLYVHDPTQVEKLVRGDRPPPDPRREALEKLARHAPGKTAAFEALTARFPKGEPVAEVLFPRVAELMLYQNEAYAGSYLDFVLRVDAAEREKTPGRGQLTEAAARWLFKLMAYKDEYEVARLWLQDTTWEDVATRYDGRVSRFYQLHPPLLRALGLHRKIRLGGWFTPLLRLLKSLKGLRGTALDVFGYAAIRARERALIGWYQETVASLLPGLTHENHRLAVTIAATPDGIRGYETVKERMVLETEQEVSRLLKEFHREDAPRVAV